MKIKQRKVNWTDTIILKCWHKKAANNLTLGVNYQQTRGIIVYACKVCCCLFIYILLRLGNILRFNGINRVITVYVFDFFERRWMQTVE